MDPDHAAPVEDLFKDSGMNTSQVEYAQNDYLGSELWLPGYEHLIDIPENLLEHPGVQGLSVPTQKVTMTTSQFGEHPNRQSVAQCSNSESTQPTKKFYFCDICRQKFSHPSGFSRHKQIHTGERRFQCDECGKAFTRKDHLQQHKLIHTGQKEFSCEICGSSFAYESSLRRHKKIHTDPQSFSCEICGRSFNRERSLGRHKKMHIQKKSEELPSYDECDSLFPGIQKKPDELPSYDECDSLFPGNQQEKSPRELPSYDECDSLFPGIPQGEILYECADCAKSYPNMRRLFSHMTRKHERIEFSGPSAPGSDEEDI